MRTLLRWHLKAKAIWVLTAYYVAPTYEREKRLRARAIAMYVSGFIGQKTFQTVYQFAGRLRRYYEPK